ncbi:PucR family transcriptional regulator [Spirillospora sp. CA-294931]|uniref:PucR family transcriptional regulator n=1 Tax=Spirillospora sp. CA-294931 TaxID=3240042 RepID=UPI003D8E8C3F
MSVQARVSDLCAQDLLAGAELHGVPGPASHPVSAIDLVVPDTVLSSPLTPQGAVVLALDIQGPAEYREHLVDVLLRRTRAAGSSLLIAVGAQLPLSEATRRLAEALTMPLLVPAGRASSTELVVALRGLVETPNQAFSDLLLDVSRRLQRAPRTLDRLVELLESALPGANVYACSGRELVLAGTPRFTTPAEVVERGSPSFVQRDDFGAAVVPVAGLAGETSVWLVAERERVGRLWLDSAVGALGLCGGTVLAWLAREQAALDRDVRMRSTLLTEILDHGQALPRDLAERAARAGWQLEGWHTGIHFRFSPAAPSALAVRGLATQLRRTGLTASALVERADGWSAWLTVTREPGPDHAREIARRVEQDLHRPAEGHSVVVGIGSPQRDPAGIAVTLAEARQAAVVAASSAKPVSVRVLQELGPSRLLLGWYSSEAFADYAREMLGPLLDNDEPELIRTLEAYLERACSAAQTARVLGVHRNTVAQRVTRAERILGTTIATADTRLALQLAIRVLRTHTT